MKLYFKAIRGFGHNGDSVSFTTPQDLENALYYFASKEDGFLAGRPIRGVDIIGVEPVPRPPHLRDVYIHHILATDGISSIR